MRKFKLTNPVQEATLLNLLNIVELDEVEFDSVVNMKVGDVMEFPDETFTITRIE